MIIAQAPDRNVPPYNALRPRTVGFAKVCLNMNYVVRLL